MTELTINFGFVSNAQSLDTNIREFNTTSNAFARMIVNDVGLAAAEDAYLANRKTLVESLKKAAMGEVSRMAMLISNSIALPDKYPGPHGEMSIKEGMAITADRFGFRETFDRERTSIVWPKRRKSYLDWKARHGHPARWWEMTGDMARGLKSPDLYLNAFGPVNVLFTRTKDQDKAKANMPRSFINSGGGTSDSRDVAPSITHGGRAGRISSEFQVGRLEVITFGNITPAMLPALKHPKMDPAYAAPNDNGLGMAGLFRDDGPGGLRNKLLGRQKQRRYAIEPFVSFFLTRAIPNAIWRRTERLIQEGAVRHSSGSGLEVN